MVLAYTKCMRNIFGHAYFIKTTPHLKTAPHLKTSSYIAIASTEICLASTSAQPQVEPYVIVDVRLELTTTITKLLLCKPVCSCMARHFSYTVFYTMFLTIWGRGDSTPDSYIHSCLSSAHTQHHLHVQNTITNIAQIVSLVRCRSDPTTL